TTVNAFTSISGSASDTGGSGVASVEISLKRNSDNHYWNGTDWLSTSEVWLGTTGTTSWSKTAGLPTGLNLLDVSYTVRSRATDNATNQQTPRAGNTLPLDHTAP